MSPRIVVSSLVVDSHEPEKLAAFWYELLGGEVMVWPQYGVVSLRAPGITIDFVVVPDDKVVKNRVHLDLASDAPEEAVARALSFGATRADDIHTADDMTVLRDPEGNEFCILYDMPFDRPWQPK
jgi:hypothetical protein